MTELAGPKGTVRCLTFSRDNKILVSGTGAAFGDRSATLWDVASRKLIRRLPRKYTANTVAVSPDGKVVGVGGGDEIKLWQVSTGEPLRRFHGFLANSSQIAFTPDGKRLVGVCDDAIRTWDTATWEQANLGPGHTTVIHQVAFTPDGRTLVSLGGDGSLLTWDPRSGKERHRLAPSRGGSSRSPKLEVRGPLALAPDGKTAATFAYIEGAWVAFVDGLTNLVLSTRTRRNCPVCRSGCAGR